MGKRLALVNQQTGIVDNVIMKWEAPEGFDVVELDDVTDKDVTIGYGLNEEGKLAKTAHMIEQEAKQRQKEQEAAEKIVELNKKKLDQKEAKKAKLKAIRQAKEQMKLGNVNANEVLEKLIDVVLEGE